MNKYNSLCVIILIIILIIIGFNIFIKSNKSKKPRCVFCLCVREVGPYLDDVFVNIKKLETLFDNPQIVFFYDKSNDNTLSKLRSYQKKQSNIHIIINNEPLLEYRTYRIANGRNKLLEYVYTNYSEYDYFIMMDSDDVSTKPLDINVLSKYLHRDDWDSLSFNRRNYYDIWALLYGPFKWDCWGFGDLSSDIVDIMRKDIIQKLDNLEEGKLFPCISAFNGFAIYRINKFRNVFYDGKRSSYNISDKHKKQLINHFYKNFGLKINISYDYPELCEHILFHIKSTKYNNAKIRIAKDYLFN